MNDGLRLDKWLWYARFYKTRSLAAKTVAGGEVRVNGKVVDKPHHAVKIGDAVVLPLGSRLKIVEVLNLGERRGPAPEAQSLYRDLERTKD